MANENTVLCCRAFEVDVEDVSITLRISDAERDRHEFELSWDECELLREYLRQALEVARRHEHRIKNKKGGA